MRASACNQRWRGEVVGAREIHLYRRRAIETDNGKFDSEFRQVITEQLLLQMHKTSIELRDGLSPHRARVVRQNQAGASRLRVGCKFYFTRNCWIHKVMSYVSVRWAGWTTEVSCIPEKRGSAVVPSSVAAVRCLCPPPTKENLSRSTRSLVCFAPVSSSTHVWRRKRPSTKRGLPFLRYLHRVSACCP